MMTPAQKVNAINKKEHVDCETCGRKISMNRNRSKIIYANRKMKHAIVCCSKKCFKTRKDK